MHVYRYSFWKLLIATLLCVAFAFGGYWLSVEFTRKLAFAGYMLMAIFPVVGLFCLRFLLSNREILRIGPHGIEYKTAFGEQRVVWRDFLGAQTETVTTYGVMTSTARHLVLDFGKGYFGNCRISEKLLESGVEVEDIMATLQESMQRAVAQGRGDYGHTSLGQGAAPGRQAQPAVTAAPVVSGFGRKGL